MDLRMDGPEDRSTRGWMDLSMDGSEDRWFRVWEKRCLKWMRRNDGDEGCPRSILEVYCF